VWKPGFAHFECKKNCLGVPIIVKEIMSFESKKQLTNPIAGMTSVSSDCLKLQIRVKIIKNSIYVATKLIIALKGFIPLQFNRHRFF